MFAPRVMVIKISKLAHFLYLVLARGKDQSQFRQKDTLKAFDDLQKQFVK